MFPTVSLGALNIFDLRQAENNYDSGLRANFAAAGTSSAEKPLFSLAHPRVGDSPGVNNESPHGKVLPFLLA